ncbi:MAG: glycerol-3-phosphate 1-O-acyltransferase PlsY [Chloroflexi bacterium]|nr:glycerol-3-phosphate 1-O-acyltransferase PlsY [Chloroflexota bacterium]
MSDPWGWIIALAAAYLLGSVPFGVIITRLVSGVDVRLAGSGSTGATNVMRTSGAKAGVAALLLDGGKGAVAVLVGRWLADGQPELVEALAGLLVIMGHNWPIFTGFKGGKGVAAGWAALTVISPWACVVAMIGLPIAARTRYVSLGSIIGSSAGLIFLTIQVLVFDYGEMTYLVYVVAGGTLVLWRHAANMKRLLKGEENKLGHRVEPQLPETTTS